MVFVLAMQRHGTVYMREVDKMTTYNFLSLPKKKLFKSNPFLREPPLFFPTLPYISSARDTDIFEAIGFKFSPSLLRANSGSDPT